MSEVCVWRTGTRVHLCYNSGKDKRQQKAMKMTFQLRASQSETENLAIMHYFRKGTPMYRKKADGGAVLGWADCSIVCAAGADVHRFYTKDDISNDITITWITPELRAKLNARADEMKATRADGNTAPTLLGIEASSDRFKYD